jgi:hypothetical protein
LKVKRVRKRRVLKEIEGLPEDHLREVQEFVYHLLKTKRKAKSTKLTSHKDPILELIGIADVEPFGHNIDSVLYGD